MKRILVLYFIKFSFLCMVSIPGISNSGINEHAAPPSGLIKPVRVIKNLSDDELLETVQRQTFRYFWHFSHPKSGMALERSNTVKGDFYWDYINEADGYPNFSKRTFGREACAVG